MKIKKYLVKNIDEAITRIKKDLGKDAYILSQEKVVRRGALNLGTMEMIEVTAAVDDTRPRQEDISASLLNRKYNYVNPPKDDEIDLSGFKNELQPLTREMAEIKTLLRKSTTGLDGFNDFKGIFLELFMDLVDNGVERKLAARFIDTLQYQADAEQTSDHELVRKKLFNLLVAAISAPAPLRLEKGKRKIVVMVGSTGSGKTTTIAKLSSYFKLMEAKKLALLSIDSYRIGAEAHLRTYAEILDIPFYPINNGRDLRLTSDKLNDFELLFIDTTGRSPNDKEGLLIMEKHLAGVPPTEREVYLILSAPTRSEDLYLIYEKYSIFKPDKLIFSKIDESAALGNLFNLKMKTDIPMAYFTTGQKVPEDIEIAYPRKFARRVFSYNNKGDIA
jgi:flagellar biosynthesis protein FlhF